MKKLENVKKDHIKRLEELEVEQSTDAQKAQLIEINLSLVCIYPIIAIFLCSKLVMAFAEKSSKVMYVCVSCKIVYIVFCISLFS